ncbi:hypothetical protein GCM10027570_36700 [Streptomonospora sediminis]
MTAHTPHGSAPADGSAFPGPPGGPLPPDGPGGQGGPAPDGAPAPGDRARRRRWRVAAAVAAGAAALGVAAGLGWVAVENARPYADLAPCERLLPRHSLAGLPGLDGAAAAGEELGPGGDGETYDKRSVEQVECWTGSDRERSAGPVAISMRRHSPATRESDYAPLQRALDRHQRALAGGLAAGSAARQKSVYYRTATADVEVRTLDTGDEGFLVSYTGAEPAYTVPWPSTAEHWAVAQYRDRNLFVQVTYAGAPEMGAEAELAAVSELAELVQRRAAETARLV